MGQVTTAVSDLDETAAQRISQPSASYSERMNILLVESSAEVIDVSVHFYHFSRFLTGSMKDSDVSRVRKDEQTPWVSRNR